MSLPLLSGPKTDRDFGTLEDVQLPSYMYMYDAFNATMFRVV